MAVKLLIVDDDRDLVIVLRKYLESHGFKVSAASNGATAISAIAKKRPDLILADVDMPRMDGLTFCRKIKESEILSSIPLIIMSGKKISEMDMISGYSFGADDYISKPFSYQVLTAKIKAMLKITGAYAEKSDILTYAEKSDILTHLGLEINTKSRTVTISGNAIKLTTKEFDLLSVLVENRGAILSAQDLLESVWGYNTDDYNNFHTVEVHMSNLRKKLGSYSKNIIAVPGHGYKID